MLYTPINKWKLTRRGREIFDLCEKLSRSSVSNIYLSNDNYKLMIDGIPGSDNNEYENGIPFMGKLIVRKL